MRAPPGLSRRWADDRHDVNATDVACARALRFWTVPGARHHTAIVDLDRRATFHGGHVVTSEPRRPVVASSCPATQSLLGAMGICLHLFRDRKGDHNQLYPRANCRDRFLYPGAADCLCHRPLIIPRQRIVTHPDTIADRAARHGDRDVLESNILCFRPRADVCGIGYRPHAAEHALYATNPRNRPR